MNVIAGATEIVTPPDWTALFSDVMEVAAAQEHWRIITIEMRESGTLSASNGHSVQRLVCAYILYDRASRDVAERGVVVNPRKGNVRAIPRVNPSFNAMREASADATALEAELGLSPRRRGAVTKVQRKERRARAADSYLRPVGGSG